MEDKSNALEMMVIGTFDLFEIRMEPLELNGIEGSVLDAPHTVSILPESHFDSLRMVLNGEIMFGHAPFVNAEGLDLIVAPRRMIALMKKHGYDLTLMPDFQQLVDDDLLIQTENSRLNCNLLDIEWLQKAHQTSWLGSQLSIVRAEKKLLEEQYCNDDGFCCDNTVNTLLSEKKYTAAAFVLMEQWDESEETRPIQVAIELDSPELVLSLIGLDGLKQCAEDNYLAIAMAYNRRAIFNLLLLHPDINVNDSYESSRGNRDIAEFCGNYGWFDRFSALVWLVDEQYDFLYPHLKIYWDDAYTDADGTPLMMYFYNNRDFNSMSRLAALGVNINPESCYGGDTLLSVALNDFDENKLETQFGAKWFAEQASLSNKNEECISEFVIEFFNGEPVPNYFISLFPFSKIRQLESEIYEQQQLLESAESYCDTFTALTHASLNAPPRNKLKTSSITDDLLRLNRVTLDDDVFDIQFATSNKGIEFGVLLHGEEFPHRFILPSRIISNLRHDLNLTHYHPEMTTFQWQAILLCAPPKFFVVLNLLAKDKGLPLFKRVTGFSISDIHRQAIVNDIMHFGGIKGDILLIEELYNELNSFDSLRLMLSNEGFLAAKFSEADLIEMKEHRTFYPHRKPHLNVEFDMERKNKKPRVRVDFKGEFSSGDVYWDPINKDRFVGDLPLSNVRWSEVLFHKPIVAYCSTCGVMGYRFSFAYEDECLECINAPVSSEPNPKDVAINTLKELIAGNDVEALQNALDDLLDLVEADGTEDENSELLDTAQDKIFSLLEVM